MTNIFSWFRTLFLAIFSSSSLIEKKNSSAAYKKVDESRNQVLKELGKYKEALLRAWECEVSSRNLSPYAMSYGGDNPERLEEIRLYFYLKSLQKLTLSTFQWRGNRFGKMWDHSCAIHRQDHDLFVLINGVWHLRSSVGYGAFIGTKVVFYFPWLWCVSLELKVEEEEVPS